MRTQLSMPPSRPPYGLPVDITDDDGLRELLNLNGS